MTDNIFEAFTNLINTFTQSSEIVSQLRPGNITLQKWNGSIEGYSIVSISRVDIVIHMMPWIFNIITNDDDIEEPNADCVIVLEKVYDENYEDRFVHNLFMWRNQFWTTNHQRSLSDQLDDWYQLLRWAFFIIPMP